MTTNRSAYTHSVSDERLRAIPTEFSSENLAGLRAGCIVLLSSFPRLHSEQAWGWSALEFGFLPCRLVFSLIPESLCWPPGCCCARWEDSVATLSPSCESEPSASGDSLRCVCSSFHRFYTYSAFLTPAVCLVVAGKSSLTQKCQVLEILIHKIATGI